MIDSTEPVDPRLPWPVAILAGGFATRLGSAAATTPKILLDVAGRPFAEHQIVFLRSQGVGRIVYCVGHLGDQVRDVLGDGSRFGMRFDFLDDGPTPAGTGGAVKRALQRLGDRFFVMYGDSYLSCSLADVMKAFQVAGQPALMCVFRNDNRWDASNVVYEGGRVVAYDKQRRTPAMHHIDYGCGILSPQVFDRWPGDRPFDLADVYRALAAEGRLAGFEVRERFYEIGSPAGLAETRAYLAGATSTS